MDGDAAARPGDALGDGTRVRMAGLDPVGDQDDAAAAIAERFRRLAHRLGQRAAAARDDGLDQGGDLGGVGAGGAQQFDIGAFL